MLVRRRLQDGHSPVVCVCLCENDLDLPAAFGFVYQHSVNVLGLAYFSGFSRQYTSSRTCKECKSAADVGGKAAENATSIWGSKILVYLCCVYFDGALSNSVCVCLCGCSV